MLEWLPEPSFWVWWMRRWWWCCWFGRCDMGPALATGNGQDRPNKRKHSLGEPRTGWAIHAGETEALLAVCAVSRYSPMEHQAVTMPSPGTARQHLDLAFATYLGRGRHMRAPMSLIDLISRVGTSGVHGCFSERKKEIGTKGTCR